jgi:RNA polymerase sigma-70 factor (ECF subfamily)
VIAPAFAPSLDEPALVAAAARGDREALGALYDRYAGLLLGVALRMLDERREAEDLVHDVFLEAWQKAATYDAARGSVRAWLLLRMRSRCLDRLKSAQERLTRALGDLDPPARRSPSLGGGDESDAAKVRAGLSTLPTEQRQVLELSYFAGLSGSEISSQLGVPLGTVKSRAAAALDKLRSALGVRGLEDQ